MLLLSHMISKCKENNVTAFLKAYSTGAKNNSFEVLCFHSKQSSFSFRNCGQEERQKDRKEKEESQRPRKVLFPWNSGSPSGSTCRDRNYWNGSKRIVHDSKLIEGCLGFMFLILCCTKGGLLPDAV